MSSTERQSTRDGHAIVATFGSQNVRAGFAPQASCNYFPIADAVGENLPIVRGVVKDWDKVDQLWEHVFGKVLQVQSDAFPLLFADSPCTTETARAKMAEILFEKYNVPAYFVGTDAVMSVYSVGRTSSLVVDSGYGVTHAMTVSDGWIMPATERRLEMGGGDLTAYLAELLSDRGIQLDASGGIAVANHIKETHGRVALDFVQESLACRTRKQDSYTLPDGTTINLLGEHLRCFEPLFQPALIGCRGSGIQDILLEMIAYCDKDREGGPIRSLTNFVLFSGGITYLSGLDERIKKELLARYPGRDLYMSCLPEAERRDAAWVGGSILASLPTFIDNNFVSLAEFKEIGAGAVSQKCC